jgi:uncharacterized protein (DUF2252 family)
MQVMGAFMRLVTTQPQQAKIIALKKPPVFIRRPTRAELYAMGESLRKQCPRSSHADWKPSKERSDPVQLVEEGDKGRIPQLVPLRHGRMLASPFTFYRGAALNMAADLAVTPTTGVRVQACGDAHLVNFRGFATPERQINFDIHDLDETLPAPWEWDLKRLATSFVVACRDNGLDKGCAEDAALACARSYREHMADYSETGALDVWYARLDPETLLSTIENPRLRKNIQKRLEKRIAKEKARSALEHDFPKLARNENELAAIQDNPPTIYHWHEDGSEEFDARVKEGFLCYRDSLTADRRVLLDRYEFKDIALKVVGVGSVGTVCGVILLMAGENDPLFLQLKEARPSVLEAYAGKSAYSNHGQRVVMGHRLMQSASDIFLGWTEGKAGRHFYIRQLRDAKIKPRVETFNAADMVVFAQWCGHSLARSHARSGEAAVIAGYLGESDTFDTAIAAFSAAYADQTERDHAALKKTARNGRLKVLIERE